MVKITLCSNLLCVEELIFVFKCKCEPQKNQTPLALKACTITEPETTLAQIFGT